MSEDRPIYEQQEAEPTRWYSRFLLFRDMGSNRTLLGTVNKEEAQKGTNKQSKIIPGAWHTACEQWNWRERATVYDREQERLKAERQAQLDAIEQAEIERILKTGYARMEARVQALDTWAKHIETTMLDPNTKEINPKWMAPDKLREWRGMLDDIAKELGHRVKVTKNEVTGKDGGAIETENNQVVWYLPQVGTSPLAATNDDEE